MASGNRGSVLADRPHEKVGRTLKVARVGHNDGAGLLEVVERGCHGGSLEKWGVGERSVCWSTPQPFVASSDSASEHPLGPKSRANHLPRPPPPTALFRHGHCRLRAPSSSTHSLVRLNVSSMMQPFPPRSSSSTSSSLLLESESIRQGAVSGSLTADDRDPPSCEPVAICQPVSMRECLGTGNIACTFLARLLHIGSPSGTMPWCSQMRSSLTRSYPSFRVVPAFELASQYLH
jgi:hypothetical protein